MDHFRALLASLNKTERRYVDLRLRHATGGTKDRGYQLFRKLITHPTESDETLAKRLGYATKSAFSTRKHDVLQRVLLALVDYDAGRHERLRILREVAIIRALNDRGQTALAHKKLRKAEQDAEQLEFLEGTLLLISEERRLFYKIHPKPEWENARVTFNQNIKTATTRIANRAFYLEKVMLLNELNGSKAARRDEEVNREADALLKDPLLQDESMALSSAARYNYLTVHRLVAELKGDRELEMSFSKRLAEHVLDPTQSTSRDKLAKVLSLAVFCDSHAHLGDPEDPFYIACEQALREMREVELDRVNPCGYYLLMSHGGGLVTAIKQKRYRLALDRTYEAQKDIARYPGSLKGKSHQNLHMLFAVAQLLNMAFDEALTTITDILASGDGVERMDFYNTCLLLELILHFELGHDRFVASKTTTLSAHFRHLDLPHRFESTFISHLGRINRTAVTQRQPLWNAFAQALEDLRTDEQEQIMFLTVDLLEHWVKPKSIGLP